MALVSKNGIPDRILRGDSPPATPLSPENNIGRPTGESPAADSRNNSSLNQLKRIATLLNELIGRSELDLSTDKDLRTRLFDADQLLLGVISALFSDKDPRVAIELIGRAMHSLAVIKSCEFRKNLTPASSKKLRNVISETSSILRHIRDSIGLRRPTFVLDPADSRLSAFTIATALLTTPCHSLAQPCPEYGSGIYALFYVGDIDYYLPLRGSECPIYVGSARPTSEENQSGAEESEALVRRLSEHKKSIAAVEARALEQNSPNLHVDDIRYRYLCVRVGFELSAEAYLIRHFKPVWNKETGICYGLGKHGDQPIGRNNERSPWDTVHPGRPMAYREGQLPNSKSAEDIKKIIREHLQQNPPRPLTLAEVLGQPIS